MNVHLNFLDYAVLVVYLIIMLAMGFFFARRERNVVSSHPGGLNMPWFAAGLSLFITLFSSISFLAVPEEAYKNGLRMWLGDVIGFLCIPLGLWLFVRFYYKLGCFTPYKYIEMRFSPSVRLIASSLFLMTRGLYLSIVLYATAKIFSAVAGWEPWVVIVFVGIMAAIITSSGGMKAVIWTNVVQCFILVGGILFAIFALLQNIDTGVVGVYKYAFANSRGFNFEDGFFSFNPYERVTVWWLLLMYTAVYLSYYATDQMAIQQLLATKTYKDARKAAFSYIPIVIPVMALFWFMGLALFYMYSNSGEQVSPDKAFVTFLSTKLTSPVPGFILAGLAAAILSTIDSGIGSLSTVIVKDFHERFFKTKESKMREITVTRIASLACSIYMVLGALTIFWVSQKAAATVLEVSSIWQSLNGIVLGIFILGILGTRVDTKSVYIAASAGLCALVFCVVFLFYRQPESQRISFMIVGNSGLMVTVLVGFVLGLFCKKHPEIKGLTIYTINDDNKNLGIAEPMKSGL